jgi:hypothetical protein
MRHILTVPITVAALVAIGSGASAQQAEGVRYRPSQFQHEGREIVAVVVGSSECGWSNLEDYVALVDPMLRALQAQAEARGLGFTAIGVALDEPADSGIAYLKRLAAFDEVLAGRVWSNTGLTHFFPPGTAGQTPSTPMLLIQERQYSDGLYSPRTQDVHSSHILRGAENIMAFARRGAPLNELVRKE